MATRVIEPEPDGKHRCAVKPNWLGVIPALWNAAPGTVVECECGKSWVAKRDRPEYRTGYMGVRFYREGWWAKRKRKKREYLSPPKPEGPVVKYDAT